MSNKTLTSNGGNFPYSHLAINKNRLKEFNLKNTWYSTSCDYYLSANTEFQIEIFNPESKTIGVRISLNGKKISSSLLVLYPGQRVWLERDFNNDNKFKFIVYEVDANNPVIEKAIADNGKIKIEFFKEETAYDDVLTYTNWKSVDNNWLTNYNDRIIDATCNYSSVDSVNAVGSTTCYMGDEYSRTLSTSVEPKTKETGIVGRSEKLSNQKFHDVSGIEFENYPFRTEELNMHPLSEKRIIAEDTQIRRYCSHCGKKLKPTFKYCPACGTKVE